MAVLFVVGEEFGLGQRDAVPGEFVACNGGAIRWDGNKPIVASPPDPSAVGPDGRLPYAPGFDPEDD